MNSPDEKVLWLSFPFPPAMSAGVFRSVRFVKYLPEFGWRPLVFTVKPDSQFPLDQSLTENLPEDLIVESTRMWRPDQWKSRLWPRKKTSQQSEGIRAKQSKSPQDKTKASNEGSILRRCYRIVRERILATPDPKIWWVIPSFWRAVQCVRKNRPRVIFSTAPPNSSHLLGVWLKRWTGLPLVLDFRDPWTRSPWNNQKDKYLFKVNCRMERSCIEAADAVILNTSSAQQEFIEYYGTAHAHKFHAIYNGYSPQLLDQVQALVRSTPKSDELAPLKLCHVGAIYGRREIRPLLHAIAQVASAGKKVVFEQVGLVKTDYDLEDFIRENNLTQHVFISPSVPHKEALRRMATADALLLIQPDGNLQIPGKLFEMILYSKPIVSLTGEGATRDIVSKYSLGPIADPFDEQSIADAINSLCQKSYTSQAKWKAVRAAFDGRNQTKQLANVFDDVCC